MTLYLEEIKLKILDMNLELSVLHFNDLPLEPQSQVKGVCLLQSAFTLFPAVNSCKFLCVSKELLSAVAEAVAVAVAVAVVAVVAVNVVVADVFVVAVNVVAAPMSDRKESVKTAPTEAPQVTIFLLQLQSPPFWFFPLSHCFRVVRVTQRH